MVSLAAPIPAPSSSSLASCHIRDGTSLLLGIHCFAGGGIATQVWQEVMRLNIIYLRWHPLGSHALVIATNTYAHKGMANSIHSAGLDAGTHPRRVV